MDVIEKISAYLVRKNITVQQAEKDIGVSNGTLAKPIKKGTSIKVETLEKFLTFYVDLNPSWLFIENDESGEKMLKIESKGENPYVKGEKSLLENVEDKVAVYKLRTDRDVSEQFIPVYKLEATAGLESIFNEPASSEILDTIMIPNLPKSDGALFVTGDSMYPLLKSGDIIVFKQVHDLPSDIFWGQMYIVSVGLNGDEYVSVKFVQRSDLGKEYIKLVSENRHHQDKDVHLSKIKGMALIKASLRYHTMN